MLFDREDDVLKAAMEMCLLLISYKLKLTRFDKNSHDLTRIYKNRALESKIAINFKSVYGIVFFIH